METAIRWNQVSTPSDPTFLVVDVTGLTFKHCRVLDSTAKSLTWEEISRNSRAPAFRAFDWNFRHNVVAIGQWSGEANVLHLDNESEALSLPIRSQRQCNAVAFNPETLLATGLERVRNDFCLNVYDIVHWAVSQPANKLLPSRSSVHEPIRKFATSEGITSIKFFSEEPNVLVAGVKGTCVRIYDLREHGGNPAIQYNTACAHNIAVDPCDSNFFASAGPLRDSTVQVWDRRSAKRPTATTPAAGVQFANADIPLLELKDVFETGGLQAEPLSIWSLRYSIAERGSLGVLGSNGSVRIFEIRRPFERAEIAKTYSGTDKDSTQSVYVGRTETIGLPLHPSRKDSKITEQDETEKVSAFDFINVLSCNRKSSAITLYATQDIRLRELSPSLPTIATSWQNSIALSTPPSNVRIRGSKSTLKGIICRKPPQGGPISELRQIIKTKLNSPARLHEGKSPISPSVDDWDASDDDGDDGWVEETPSAQSSPLKLEAKGTFPQPEKRIILGTIRDALVLADTSRQRCMEGYLFDPAKNAEISQEDDELRWMWGWIEVAKRNSLDDKMVANGVDLSYLGVQSIWDGNLGHDPTNRIRRPELSIEIPKVVSNLINSLELPNIDLPRTAKSDQRRLSLFILGFDPTSDVLLANVKALALAGHNSEAALHALLGSNPFLASTALRSGPRHSQNKALSLLLSLFATQTSQASLLPQITAIGSTEKDPFSLGILSLLTSQTTTSPPLLPPTYQLGLALKSLPDAGLRSYLANALSQATKSGDPAYLPLTGITPLSIRLFENYLSRTSDLQSVVLALGYASPLYFRHPRVEAWRTEYRSGLNKHKLYIKRALLDMQGTKLSMNWEGRRTMDPERRQVTLKCTNCDGPLEREQEEMSPKNTSRPPLQPSHSKKPSQTLPHSPMLPHQSSNLSTMTTLSGPAIRPAASAESSFTSIASDFAEPFSAGPVPPPSVSLAPRFPSVPPDPNVSELSTATQSSTLAASTDGAVPPAGGGQPQPRILGGPRDGTMCPNCGARLPRCAVCDFWVGEVDPRSKGARAKVKARQEKDARRRKEQNSELKNGAGKLEDEDERGGMDGSTTAAGREDKEIVGKGKNLGAKKDNEGESEGSEEEKNTKGQDPMEGFIEICLTCRHVYHRGHAKEWFRRHDECAVVGCRCKCGSLDYGH